VRLPRSGGVPLPVTRTTPSDQSIATEPTFSTTCWVCISLASLASLAWLSTTLAACAGGIETAKHKLRPAITQAVRKNILDIGKTFLFISSVRLMNPAEPLRLQSVVCPDSSLISLTSPSSRFSDPDHHASVPQP